MLLFSDAILWAFQDGTQGCWLRRTLFSTALPSGVAVPSIPVSAITSTKLEGPPDLPPTQPAAPAALAVEEAVGLRLPPLICLLPPAEGHFCTTLSLQSIFNLEIAAIRQCGHAPNWGKTPPPSPRSGAAHG